MRLEANDAAEELFWRRTFALIKHDGPQKIVHLVITDVPDGVTVTADDIWTEYYGRHGADRGTRVEIVHVNQDTDRELISLTLSALGVGEAASLVPAIRYYNFKAHQAGR